MSKEEIVNELQSWLTAEDFAPNKEKVEGLTTEFNALREKTEQEQKEAFIQEGGEEAAFEYHADHDDSRFKELMDIYHDKRRAADKAKAESMNQNLKEKQDLVKELNEVIQDEENIGKAYKRFNAIKQKWNEIGPVPNAERRELQAEYSRLIELFYYNINIYRELQINDLKKNQELKQAVIAEIKLLENEKSINQVDFLIHKYLHEWDEIGPTFREEWEKIREEFKREVGKVFDRIREHRNEVKGEHQENFTKKQELVNKVKAIAEAEYDDVKALQSATREVINTQKEWKKLGYAGRGKNDRIWKEFRGACDSYFSKRDAFMKAHGAEFEKTKSQKQALIDRAKEIHEGEDYQAISNELKGLQRQWKQSGKLLPHEEYKMFKEFRKYCDAFFNRKKKQSEQAIKAAKEALQAKEAFLIEVSKKIEIGIEKEGEAAINQWREEWNAWGDVPFKMRQKVDKAFETAVTKAYKSLGISMEEVEEKRFESKIEALSESDRGDDGLKRERANINQQIRDKQTDLAQEESKLDFFKFSDDSNPLKKELLQRIDGVKEEIESLKEKKKKIDLTLKGMKQEQSEVPSEDQSESEG